MALTKAHNRMISGAVFNVLDYGADNTGVADSSAAIQAAVNATGNAATSNGATVYLPAGTYKITKPIIIHQKDGLSITGDGRWATILQMSGAMTPDTSVVSGFPADNSYNDFVYTTNPCAIMVSARRVTGGVDGALNPSGANAAAWYLTFKGLSIIGDPASVKTSDGIYCPEIGLSRFEDLLFRECRSGIKSRDLYLVNMAQCHFELSTRPIEHFSTGSATAQGTTLNMETCSANRLEYGWRFIGLNYSSFNNCSNDDWATDQGDIADKYAWSFSNCDIVLNGCGAESSTNTQAATNSGGIYIENTSKIVMNACNFRCVVDATSLAALSTIDNSSLIVNQTAMSNTVGGSVKKIILQNGANVVCDGWYGAANLDDMITVADTTSSLRAFQRSEMQAAVANATAWSFPVVTSVQTIPATKTFDQQGLLTSDGSAFTAKIAGLYEFTWTFRLSGGVFQFAEIYNLTTAASYDQITLTTDAYANITFTMRVVQFVAAGNTIAPRLRNQNSEATGVVQYHCFTAKLF